MFPSAEGGPLDGINVYHRDFLPSVEAAGLRRITFHALRHSYASHLIQAGASLTYVKEQMGHSSIQVTVDTYGHLVPGADIAWVDKLDAATKPQPSATYTQPDESKRGVVMPQLLETLVGPQGFEPGPTDYEYGASGFKVSLTPAESAQPLCSQPVTRNLHLCGGLRTFVYLCLV